MFNCNVLPIFLPTASQDVGRGDSYPFLFLSVKVGKVWKSL